MFYITAATLPYLKKEIRTDIINISSIWGVEYNPSLISYSSSKFAVEGYTGGVRLWGMPQNIRVCSIQVDKVNTDFRRNFKGFPEIPPENLAKMLHPDDIASAVNFILSSSNTAQISSILPHKFLLYVSMLHFGIKYKDLSNENHAQNSSCLNPRRNLFLGFQFPSH